MPGPGEVKPLRVAPRFINRMGKVWRAACTWDGTRTVGLNQDPVGKTGIVTGPVATGTLVPHHTGHVPC